MKFFDTSSNQSLDSRLDIYVMSLVERSVDSQNFVVLMYTGGTGELKKTDQALEFVTRSFKQEKRGKNSSEIVIALLTRNLTTESYRVMREVILSSAYQNNEKFQIKFIFFCKSPYFFAQNRSSIIICFLWTLKAISNCNSSMNKIIFSMIIA